MNQVRSSENSTFLSPVVNRGFRKPFGELTNTPPSSHNKRTLTPSKDVGHRTPNKQLSSTPSSTTKKGELTPLANLKLLMRVASESAQIQDSNQQQEKPSRRELFKGEDEDDQENQHHLHPNLNLGQVASLPPPPLAAATIGISSGLIIDDHDYSSDKSAAQTPTSTSSSFCSPFNGGGLTPVNNPNNGTSGPTNKVSRKDKSLGLLCDKFISRFPKKVPAGEKCDVQLDDLAKQMGTERRRIYDIVNVLESVQMMTKIGKNLYAWHGTTHQRMTLARLRQIGIKFDMLQRYLAVKAEEQSNSSFSSTGGGGGITPTNHTCHGLVSPMGGYSLSDSVVSTPASSVCNSSISSCSPSLTPSSGLGTSPSPSPSPSGPTERKTSLGKACQRFLMLFLVLPEQHAKLNLELAARVIHGPEQETVMKTRIRRLYDIANILQSLKLIQKVTVISNQEGGSGTGTGKKPAFQYIGPNIEGIEVTREALQTLPTARQRHSLLAIGKNLANLPDEPPATTDGQHTNHYFSMAKKRMAPDTGFSSTMVGREPKLLRTQSSESSSPIFHFAVPHPSPSSFRRTASMVELKVRSPSSQSRLLHLRPINSAHSQRQLFGTSPSSTSTSITLSPINSSSLLRPRATPPSPQSQPQDLSVRRKPSPKQQQQQKAASPVYPRTKKQQMMRLVGLGRQSGFNAKLSPKPAEILLLSPRSQGLRT